MRLKPYSLLYWSLEALVIALLIWVCSKLDFVLQPIGIFISVTFTPLIISTFLYYMLNPKSGRSHVVL